jgi:hypothetical protein
MYIFYTAVSIFFLYSIYTCFRPKVQVKFETEDPRPREALFEKIIVYTDTRVMTSDSYIENIVVDAYKFSVLKYTIDSHEFHILIKDKKIRVPDIIVKPPIFINKIKKALIQIDDPPSIHDVTIILNKLIGPNYDFYGETLDVYDVLFMYTRPGADKINPEGGMILLYDTIGNCSKIRFNKTESCVIKWSSSILK